MEEEIKKIMDNAKDRMKKTIESFKKDITNIRSTRASAAILDNVRVEYYGTPTPLLQLASVSVPEALLLLIQPYDKSCIGDIEKALHKSDLGISPQSDGNVIRLVMPELSTERRQELVKQLKMRLEEGKISLRSIRRDGNDEIKKIKEKGVSDDQIKNQQNEMQTLIDCYVKECEELYSKKEENILKV